MLDLANITMRPTLIGAEDGGKWINIAIFVAIMVGMGIVNIIKKMLERAEEKRLQQSSDQSKQQAEQPEPMCPDEALARTVRRSMGMPDEPPPIQDEGTAWMQAAAPATVEPPPVSDARRKAQETQLARPARKKRKKRQTPQQQEVGTLSHTAEAAQTAQAVPIPAATLNDLDSVRRAIVHHEILAPPKALRNEPEMWEL